MTLQQLLVSAFSTGGHWKDGLRGAILSILTERSHHPQAHARRATKAKLDMDEQTACDLTDMIAGKLMTVTKETP